MNIRKFYLAAIFVLSASLFYQWTNDSKNRFSGQTLETARSESLLRPCTDDGTICYLENDLLKIKIAISTGCDC